MAWLLLVVGGLILINQVEKRSETSPLNSLGGRMPSEAAPSTPYYRIYPGSFGPVAGDPQSESVEISPVSVRMVGASPVAVAASPASVAGGGTSGASGGAGGGGSFGGGGGRPGIRTRVRVALL